MLERRIFFITFLLVAILIAFLLHELWKPDRSDRDPTPAPESGPR